MASGLVHVCCLDDYLLISLGKWLLLIRAWAWTWWWWNAIVHQSFDTFCYLARCFEAKDKYSQIDCFLFIKLLQCLDPSTYVLVFCWTGGARNLRKLPTRIASAFTYLSRQAHLRAHIVLALSKCYEAEANCEVSRCKCSWCLCFSWLMSTHIFFIGANYRSWLSWYGFRRMGVCLILWLLRTVKLSNQGLQLLNISHRLVTVCCIDYSSVLLEAEVHEFSAVCLVACTWPLMSILSHLSIIRKLDSCWSEYVNHFTPSSSQWTNAACQEAICCLVTEEPMLFNLSKLLNPHPE